MQEKFEKSKTTSKEHHRLKAKLVQNKTNIMTYTDVSRLRTKVSKESRNSRTSKSVEIEIHFL